MSRALEGGGAASASSASLGRAAWTASVAGAEIGEPVSFELRVRLQDGLEPTLAAWPADPLVPWALLEGPALSRLSLDGPQDEWRARYTAFALTGGELDSPGGLLLVGGEPFDAAAARVVVAGALGEGEDAPRQLLQAPSAVAPPADALGLPPLAWAWMFAAPLAALLVAWRWRSRRARVRAAAAPGPLERLAVLEAGWRKDPAEGRECLHALSALVRGVVDGRLAERRAASSNEFDDAPAPAAMGGMEWADRAEARGEAAAAGFVRRIEPLRWCCDSVPAELVAARFEEARALCATTTEGKRA
ncbi:MAG: hypothetical protein ACK57N_13860 [Planctomycetia bacterium]